MPRRKLTYVSASVKRNIVNTNVYKTDSSRPETRTLARCEAAIKDASQSSAQVVSTVLVPKARGWSAGLPEAFHDSGLEICDWNIYLPKSGGEANCSIPVNYNVTHIVDTMVEYQKTPEHFWRLTD